MVLRIKKSIVFNCLDDGGFKILRFFQKKKNKNLFYRDTIEALIKQY